MGYNPTYLAVKPDTNWTLVGIGIVMTVMTAGQSAPVFLQMYVGGMVALINGGNFAAGALTAGMMNYIGGQTEWTVGQRYTAHLFAGGISSVLQGGKFGHGFASSMMSSLATPLIESTPTNFGKITVAAIVGGTMSKLSGGKFANGALTNAFRWVFNHLSHPNGPDYYGEAKKRYEAKKLRLLEKYDKLSLELRQAEMRLESLLEAHGIEIAFEEESANMLRYDTTIERDFVSSLKRLDLRKEALKLTVEVVAKELLISYTEHASELRRGREWLNQYSKIIDIHNEMGQIRGDLRMLDASMIRWNIYKRRFSH
ncbi:hypothetical protein [Aliikangiella sp. G2MR2-5]|uniref:hypothetical protein n=1 Tax=Aliikangiella sp. G2MR2-5 TaxID=2788943 RepID=UPI0018AB5E91|nr:hypothetical protein [Aliikangiella sp. G2MR2-5]